MRRGKLGRYSKVAQFGRFLTEYLVAPAQQMLVRLGASRATVPDWQVNEYRRLDEAPYVGPAPLIGKPHVRRSRRNGRNLAHEIAPSPCPACASVRTKREISFERYMVFTCPDCSLSFGVPEVPVAEWSFDAYPWNKQWTDHYASYVEIARYSLAKKLEIARRFGSPAQSMLDIGCGNGAFLAAAERLGVYCEGIDIDLEHVRFAQSQGLRAFHCDIKDYHPRRRFDFIHMKESFHLVNDTKEFVEKAATLLSSQGVLYLDSTHHDGLASRYRRIVITPPRFGQLYPPLHNRAFCQRSLAVVLGNAGLSVRKFVTFSRGNRVYCPSSQVSVRQHTVNPLMDLVHLGGFIGCYATRRAP